MVDTGFTATELLEKLSIILNSPITDSSSSSESSSMLSSTSNWESNMTNSTEAPSWSGLPASFANLGGTSISSLSSSTSLLIYDPRMLQLALQLSRVGLSDAFQTTPPINNNEGTQQDAYWTNFLHLQQQQDLYRQSANFTCDLSNVANRIVQPTTLQPPETDLDQLLPRQEKPYKKLNIVTESVTVDTSEHVAEIVGRQGFKIKALRIKTSTYIKTPGRLDEPVFFVTGLEEDVANAKREILAAADHFSAIRACHRPIRSSVIYKVPPGQFTTKVRVPYNVVGLVVGHKGSTIKSIQQKTHTYIVSPLREAEPVFEVTGLPGNVHEACKLIGTHIAIHNSNLPQSEQILGTPTKMSDVYEKCPELLASIYKNGICSTFGYGDLQVHPNDGNKPMDGDSPQLQQHELHYDVTILDFLKNLCDDGIANNSDDNNSVPSYDTQIVYGDNGTSSIGRQSCASSSSSTSSKADTTANLRPELMNIWKTQGESRVEEGAANSSNIWTMPSITNAIGYSTSQMVSPTDSLFDCADGSNGNSNTIHTFASPNTGIDNRAGLNSTAASNVMNRGGFSLWG